MQTPSLHTWLAAQLRPHAPQFVTSLAVPTQVPAHFVWPPVQTHAPALHTLPPLQTVPHAPQLAGSDAS